VVHLFPSYSLGFQYPKPRIPFSISSFRPANSLCQIVTTVLATAVYRVTLHPLANIPGPRLWAITRLPYFYNLAIGCLHFRIHELHEQYGLVVRVAPGEITLIKYIDQFISCLRERSSKPIKLNEWYSFLVFDIMGDIIFGESFDSLETGQTSVSRLKLSL